MKKVSLFSILMLNFLLISTILLKAQSSLHAKKIESIIQLTKFIDWSQNVKFSNSKRLLYVLVDYSSPVNYEVRSKKDLNYKKWQIICMDQINDVESGSVIFITNEKQKLADKVIRLSVKKDILTISENIDDFCSNGGMINLVGDKDQFRFEINYKIIQDKSLDISSKLLALAKIYD